jgi:hypothetical protein
MQHRGSYMFRSESRRAAVRQIQRLAGTASEPVLLRQTGSLVQLRNEERHHIDDQTVKGSDA